MKLYYSPFFTGECYRNLPVGEPCFEKIVGDAGLLEYLELRLGLPGSESDAIDRILAFRSALESAMDDAFYKEAFKNDPLATAKEILRWRDILVMEGFDANTKYESARLKKLAEAEQYFCRSGLVGTPERWKQVNELSRGKTVGEEIDIYHDMTLLPKLIRESLEAVGVVKGLNDGFGSEDFPLNTESKDITILQFGTVAEAYYWAVDNNDCDAIVCPDPFRLNAVFRNREKPLLDASAGGDSSITQLFRLGLSLLERPLNVKNLLEYLRTDVSPIPCRYSLAYALKREGGLGDDWEEALAKYEDKDAIERYLLCLLDAEVREGKVSSSVVINWCQAVMDWAPNVMNEYRRPYLMELIGLCKSLCRVIDHENAEKVDVGFVMKAVKTLYSPKPVQADKAMANSWNVVASHRCIIDVPKSLMWLPCNGGLGTDWPFSFMLQEEIDELNVKMMSDYIRYDFNLMVKQLGQIDRIVLCSCDFDCDDALEEHPAVTLCKSVAKEKDMRADEGPTMSIFKPLGTIETGVDLYPDKPLSATSIDTLIGYPFDFVMAKKLGFQDLSSLHMSDLIPTQGTVAHYVFETMLKESGESIEVMREMLKDVPFKERVEKAAKEKGEILFQPEHRTLFSNFKDTVQKSIGALLDILDASGLRPIKSEEKLDQDLDFSHIIGSVDFYAETKGHDIVVIDFKYSKGKTFIEKLEEDKSIQLEIYAQGLKDKLHREVVARGYYFFPINQLHTDDEKGIFKGKGVFLHKKEKNEFTLSERIENSVAFRKSQLKNGTLEMEEGTPLEEIKYHELAADGSLIDIPEDRKVKACSPFVKPTKYPILKNFIK